MKTILKILVPLLLIALSYTVAKQMIANKPERQSKQPPTVIPTVATVRVAPATHRPPVSTFGTVQSYFETTLTPLVSGAITQVSPQFRVGALVKKGDTLATIDSTDYQAILARESATLATNKRQLAEEKIRAKQAQSDWLASGRALEKASAFVLREPQLAAAKSSIESSIAAHQKALTDIQRCSITAPFDAIITQRNASIGNHANSQSPLGRLIATERAEIRLPLTPSQAARIQLPSQDNANTEISLTSPTKPGHTWLATLKRTEPVIDPQNQVIYVIAEIEAPYSSDTPLTVGTFVNAQIPSKALELALEIPEEALINDSFLWAVDSSDELIKLDVTRLHSHLGKAYVQVVSAPIEAPYSIVSRPLTNFRSKMKVSQESAADSAL